MIQAHTFTYENHTVAALVDTNKCNWADYMYNTDQLLEHNVEDLFKLGIVVLPYAVYQSLKSDILKAITVDNVVNLGMYNIVWEQCFEQLGEVLFPSNVPTPSTTNKYSISPHPNSYIDYSPLTSDTVGYINYRPNSTTPCDDSEDE